MAQRHLPVSSSHFDTIIYHQNRCKYFDDEVATYLYDSNEHYLGEEKVKNKMDVLPSIQEF